MDAFEVHRRLIHDYRSFTEGFVDVRDKRIADVVAGQSTQGAQWPDPWLSLNPSFAPGGQIEELVASGLLHPECDRIFRIKDETSSSPITLHRHQRQAVEVAGTGASYVLTTGTGSGKSMAYIVPIVDRVLREGSGRGVQAIVVYPMNALANSQVEELGKFLHRGYDGRPPVTFKRYTGQEKREARDAILADPPDILLTNYVMLELVLTRPDERSSLVKAASGLRFLVLDELHTYRGRQGADVAMLVRRVRDACRAEDTLQCVGTSATMSSRGTIADQQAEVSAVASRLFGTPVRPEHVITESLVQATTVRVPGAAQLTKAVDGRGDAEAADPALGLGYAVMCGDPLASWIEDAFGVRTEEGSDRLVRRPPTTVTEASAELAALTGRRRIDCAAAIRATLLAGSRTRDPTTHRTLFAFRLHQFLSKGGSVYVTAEDVGERTIETDFQTVLPGSPERRLYPLAFCRECGQEYLMARLRHDGVGTTFVPRHQLRPADMQDGYLFLSQAREWPVDPIAEGRLPPSWLSVGPKGSRVDTSKRKYVPERYVVGPDGSARPTAAASPHADGAIAAWIPGAFRFCLDCGVSYETLRSNEFAKLVTLDKEGRSSAMTVVASTIVRALRAVPEQDLGRDARKLLTFVDNRQDASLQAGHLNDFVLVVQLRAALHQAAVATGEQGLDPLDLGAAVTRQLGLAPAGYAQAPEALDLRGADRALRGVVEYRALRDLQKGWRVTLPNLEQTGLLVVDYPAAGVLAERDGLWVDAHPRMRDAATGQREEIVRVLLDELRRVLAVEAEGLSVEFVDRLRREGREHLTGVWALPETEPDPVIGLAVPAAGRQGGARSVLNLTGRGMFGRWLRQRERFGVLLDTVEADEVIASLLEILTRHGLLAAVTDQGTSGYRLKSSAMTLRAGDGTAGAPDPVRRRFETDQRPRVVGFFRDLYRDAGKELAGLYAAEHTAQVRAQDREDRERSFRSGELPLLFCSPTMELGVDISSLNAVAMRNVPPTPANYAQRSGRAGRSGQPAVVVTYCSSGNSHDSYYFQRSKLMVAGQVVPPRLDLANEDLIRSHMHAVWLAEALAPTLHGLGRSMAQVLALGEPDYPVRSDLRDTLSDQDAQRRATATARALLAPLAAELAAALWWSEDWPGSAVQGALSAFESGCERWRGLYREAEAERDAAYKLASDSTLRKRDREDADGRYREARQRIELLLNESDDQGQTDFYTYRYLASEGFLPGYSFPRLPLAAFIPGSRGRGSTWLQRARFLAISEFGPGALIYHEGARYQVSRISLPRGRDAAAAGEVVRVEARVCASCGYYHPRAPGLDTCESCGQQLGPALRGLIQLQTVITRRRERISADEEERNRVGFELVTTYRFVQRGRRRGRLAASIVSPDDGELAQLTYGDGAEVRVLNLGRRNRANRDVHGFWLDLVKGRWLPERDRPDHEEPGEELETTFEDVQLKDRVTPYVEDRRNIVVLRWPEPLTEVESTTLQYAVERGIEATFQLEDSELVSELLPDDESRGRLLLIEAAEGGAGVLRRLQAEPDAVARAAAEALRIMHVDPQTGQDAEDACVRGCYRCLLSYSNQTVHELIDRRVAVDRLRSLTTARSVSASDTEETAERAWPASPLAATTGSRCEELLALLLERGFRAPDAVATTIEGVTVDLVYRGTTIPTVVLVDEVDVAPADGSALVFTGWNVLRVPIDAELGILVSSNPGVFGMEQQ